MHLIITAITKIKKLLILLVLVAFNLSSFAQSKLACGSDYTLMVRGDGTLWAWGNNSNAKFGNGTYTSSILPVQIGSAADWASVAVGFDHSMAIKTDGTLWGWGKNVYGELGDGTNSDRTSPVQIGNATTWVKVDCGANHTVALRSDGTLWSWGYNGVGQLGDGTLNNRNIPQQVGALTTWIDVSAGVFHTLAVKNNGTIWSCGYNVSGQLGNGSNSNSNILVQVLGITNAIKVDGGYQHSLAILSDNTVRSWGLGNSGQLGNGGYYNYNAPVVISGVNTAIKIAGGYFHSMILLANGTVLTCGYNQDGQLGDGTNNINYYVVAALYVSNGQDLSTLSYSSGILTSASPNVARMAGNNASGQLGDGTTTNRNTFIVSPLGTAITVTSQNGNTFCAGTAIDIKFTATGTFINNTFTVQLSDAVGSFAAPTTLLTIGGNINHSILFISYFTNIPSSTPAGTQYRIRVISSNPSFIGTDNGSNITINAIQMWYLDIDNDQYYTNSQTACSSPGLGWHTAPVIAFGDCDDNNATIYPGTTRACYTGPSGTAGVGACQAGIQTCTGMGMWSGCNGQIIPTIEICNGVDDDCNGITDQGFSPVTYYLDADNDLYYVNSQIACSSPGIGWHLPPVIANGDCNDNNAAVHPTITEICNGIDDNCDGNVDEGFNPVTYYYDNDGDNYGSTALSLVTCDPPPPGFVLTPGDCNDNNNHIWPNSPEVSNCIDDNCDGQIDEGVVPTTWYFDNDGDNFGSSPTLQNCAQPLGYVLYGGDCDNNNNMVWPGQTEIVNGIDDNCNGQIDEGYLVLNLKLFIEGYYVGGGLMQPVLFNSGLSLNSTDCDSITIELHDQFSFNTLYTNRVLLNTNGLATVNYPNSILGASYYIAIRTRNAIETWSKLPVSFNSSPVYFDFSSP